MKFLNTLWVGFCKFFSNGVAEKTPFLFQKNRKNYLVSVYNINMLLAYILINTEIGDEERVYDALNRTDGVIEAHIVYGVYDIVAKIQAEDTDELRSVVEKIRKKSGLRSTLTLIVTK
jgi:DNA-binding Lrp family transcriptional regulator